MLKITLKIDGMACGMCEAHINDAIRKKFPLKKVTSSYTKNETVIITEEDIDNKKLAEAVNATGYRLKNILKEPYKKKGIFSFFGK